MAVEQDLRSNVRKIRFNQVHCVTTRLKKDGIYWAERIGKNVRTELQILAWGVARKDIIEELERFPI
jgi:hypothetical protein